MSIEEEKYKKLRESLRALPRLKAKNDFEARLYRRLREHESHIDLHKPVKENSFVNMLANLFKPSLTPAIALTVVLLAVIVVYFAYFNELQKDNQPATEYSYSEKQGEFVIYVKKDGDRIYDETARDISSADVNQSPTTGEYKPSTDVGIDKLSMPEEQPLPSIESERRLREDRISDEQKIKMEKETEPLKKSDDIKSQPKSEDGKIMKKGYIEKESKETPYNIREKKEDTSGKDVEEEIEQKTINPQEQLNQEVDTGNKSDDDEKRLSRSRKDSLKAKEKAIEEQKDSMEK